MCGSGLASTEPPRRTSAVIRARSQFGCANCANRRSCGSTEECRPTKRDASSTLISWRFIRLRTATVDTLGLRQTSCSSQSEALPSHGDALSYSRPPKPDPPTFRPSALRTAGIWGPCSLSFEPRSAAAECDVADDQADARGRHGKPFDVAADGHDVEEHLLQGRCDGELAHRSTHLAVGDGKTGCTG